MTMNNDDPYDRSDFPVPPILPANQPPAPPVIVPVSSFGNMTPNGPFPYTGTTGTENRPPQQGFGPPRKYSIRQYADPNAVSIFLIILLICCIQADSIGFLFGFLERNVLIKIQQGLFESDAAATAAAEASDTRVALIAVLQVCLSLTCGIVFLVWTWRFCKNAHCLSTVPLPYGPGWAVGWYFVPIALLFMPYIVLRDAYKASCQPADWKMGPSSLLLGFWWFVRILTSISSQASFRMSMRLLQTDDPEIGFLIACSVIGIVDDFCLILLNIFTILVVLQCNRMQRGSFAQMIRWSNPTTIAS